MTIYDCPHCGEKTFNPITKALAGAMNSKGHACPKCGKKCVNGQTAAVVRAVLSLLLAGATVFSIVAHWSTATSVRIIFLGVVAYLLLNFLFNAFFCPLIKAIRTDA